MPAQVQNDKNKSPFAPLKQVAPVPHNSIASKLPTRNDLTGYGAQNHNRRSISPKGQQEYVTFKDRAKKKMKQAKMDYKRNAIV
jgi:hypothetical protein